MAEGGLGSKLENFRNKLSFLKRKKPEAPSLPEETESIQPIEVASANTPPKPGNELKQPEDYRQKAARDIFSTIQLRIRKGDNTRQIRALLEENPVLLNFTNQEIQQLLQMTTDTAPEVLEFITKNLPEKPSKEDKQIHKRWVYENLIQPTSAKSDQTPINTVVKEIEAQPQEDRSDGEPVPKRRLILEKFNSFLEVNDDAALEKEIRESGSEIPDGDLLKIIAYLRTAYPQEIRERFKTGKIRTGNYEGYAEIRIGPKGRVLYFIDSDKTLHLRLGSHKEILDVNRSQTK